jgi:tagaturonate reductase
MQSAVVMPDEKLFSLPEKVLQFGTGVLLRGLPDYFIDKANKEGVFNGRIVVIKSTSSGGVNDFDEQDELYTVCVRGIEGETTIEENIVNASISRVLSAKDNWDEILKCAANPDMQVVISNTTEIGITLTKDDITASPPKSFPGKLVSFLYQRYKFFNGSSTKGMVIIPTELIVENGNKLRSIVLELAKQNNLENTFLEWLSEHNHFCNSLVDRIVPGKFPAPRQEKIEKELGYVDRLMIMCEVYRLWAIESSEQKVFDVLSFSKVDQGVVITSDINTFRELKLRLLNGSHTFSCGLALLAGFETVKEAMDNKIFAGFITNLMFHEISASVVSEKISYEMAQDFANNVLDRYRNPHIEHQWLSISVQYSSKMKLRNVQTITKYYERFGTTPEYMAIGFAAFLLFLKGEKDPDGKFFGSANNKNYPINDDNASIFAEKWSELDTNTFVKNILSDKNLWEADLSEIPGFVEFISKMIDSLQDEGAIATIKKKITTESNSYDARIVTTPK